MASSDTLNKKVVIDGKSAESTLKELNKLVKSLNSNVDATGKKFTQATQNMNKMFSSYLVQLDKILKKGGVGDPEQLQAISFGRQQSKQLNTKWLTNPNRSVAQEISVNRKIIKDQATVFADEFSNRLMQISAGNKNKTALGFNPNLYRSVDSYRERINRGFKSAETTITSKLLSLDPSKQAKEYADATSQLTNLKKLQTEMIDPINQQISSYEKLQKAGGGTLALIQAKLIANYAVINSVTRAFSYLTNYVVDFDQELGNLQAISGVSDVGLSKLEKTIIDVANATKFSSLEVAQASTVLAQAGLSVEQIKQTLLPIAQLATATGTDLATSTQTITSALNIYNLQADEAAYITNALTTAMNESKAEIKGFQYALQYAGNTAANLNVTFEETAAATAALAQAGIKSVSTQGTGLRAVFTELIKPTKKFQDQLAKVGLSIDDVDVRTKGFIPVLKTLQQAGFGVTEAYRGMERRGASAMAALLGQTEFMDDLTDKMTLSTAAVSANEAQMSRLGNTLKNTKSIMGSLVYDAMRPLIRITQEVLEAFNNLTRSGQSAVVTFTTFLAIGTALGGTIAILGKTVTQIVTMVSAFSAAKTAGAGLLALFTGGSLLAWTGAAIAIGAIAAGVYTLAQSFDKAGNTYKNLVSQMEDKQGEINKAQESYNAFVNIMQRAYTQRSKFAGPEGQRELDKYVQTIITRFPQIADVMQKPIKSFEDLIEVMSEALIKMASFNAESVKGAPELAKRVTKASADLTKELSIAQQREQVDLLKRMGVISQGSADIIKNATIERNRFGGYFGGIFGKTEGINPNFLINSLRKSYQGNPEDTLTNIRKLLADSSINLSDEFRDVLTKFLDEVKKTEETNRIELKSAILTMPKASDLAKAILELNSSRLQGMQEGLRQLKSVGPREMTDKEKMDNLNLYIKTSKEIYDNLREGNVEEFSQTIGEDQLKNLANKYTKGDVNKLKRQLKDTTSDLFSEVASQFLEFIGSLTSIVDEGLEDEVKRETKEGRKKFKDSLKNLSSIGSSLINGEVEKITKELEESYKTRISFIENDKNKLFKQKEIDALNEELESRKKELRDEAAKLKGSFDRNLENQKEFFKELNAAIDSITKRYENALDALDSQYSFLEGMSSGYEEVGLGVQQDYIDSKIRQRKRNDYTLKYQYASMALQGLEARKQSLLDTVDGNKLQDRYNKAKNAWDLVLANSGDYSVNQQKEIRKEYDEATTALKNYTSTVDDIDKEMISLKKTMAELEGIITAIDYAQGKGDLTGAITKGIAGAKGKYLAENGYEDLGPNGWIMKAFGETFYTTLDSAESALANFFNTAIDGTKNTGDAFKDMCKSILDAMQQALVSQIAKQFMALLFSSDPNDISGLRPQTTQTNSSSNSFWGTVFQIGGSLLSGAIGGGAFSGGGVSTSGGTISSGYSNGSYSGLTITRSATGGIVRGGIPNKDSVPTLLAPGEYVLRKSAVDAVGSDYLNSLNAGNVNFMASTNKQLESSGDTGSEASGKNGTLNIWVVTPDQVPSENPDNIIMTVNQNIQTNGSIKQLIKQVAIGAI